MRSKTTVVHVNDPHGYDVYIGRNVGRRGFARSLFANPFSVRDWGRERSIKRYREWLLQGGLPPFDVRRPSLEDIRGLRGKRLGCWCAPKPCHGDVLAEIADGAG